ncbi:MAG TPA: phosphoglycerate dehydrogenase [Myxococcales bacterium]|jgi:D-3-phosphoglycerate dehydrogenase|nr:phosphoglycerate dehydrogenase [Myxococcales bacterium]
MRILIADDLSPEAKIILERIPGAQVDTRVGLDPAALREILGGYDALAVRSATRVTPEILAAAPRLRVIGRAGTGVDNIDLPAATRRGVVVMNAPGGNSISVAEHTLALLLALARRVPDASRSTRGGKWEKKKYSSGRELQGKTLGVIGTGNIGALVVPRAKAFGLKVIAYDPFLGEEAAQRLGVELVSLPEIFRRSDAVTLHVPLTEQTRNMVGAAQLQAMKRGALLVNCARGGLVDENALAESLKSGHLGGAALDVFETEPPPADHPLFSCDNFIATPHLGGATEDAQQSVAVIVCEAMVEYLTTGTVRNAVNVPSVSGEVLERLGPFLRLGGKLGSFAGQLSAQGACGAPEQVEIVYAGEVAQHPSAPLTAAVLKGVLGTFLAEPVNEVSAPALAKERGLGVTEVKTSDTSDFASLLTVRLRCGSGTVTEVAGTIVGKREPRLTRVGKFELEAIPEGAIVVLHNDDKPGVIGNVGRTLGEARVNIAQFALARDRRSGEALALVNVDGAVPPEVLERLRRLPDVRQADQVVL